MSKKLILLFCSFFCIGGKLVANPCLDFLDHEKINAPIFYAESDKLCFIDVRLAHQIKYMEKQVIHAKHGRLIFLSSENGNFAIVGDILAISKVGPRVNGIVGDAIGRVIRELVDCFRSAPCREMIRDYVRDITIDQVVGSLADRVVEHVRDFTNSR